MRNQFKEPVKKKKTNLKASREIAKFTILPTDTDGARACWQLGLDRRQLVLVKEEGQIVDHGKLNLCSPFLKLRICLMIVF